MAKKHLINRIYVSLTFVAILLSSIAVFFLQGSRAQAASNCSGNGDVNCVQTDGKYRCWDGSSIAMTPGVSCPANPNDNGTSNSQSACDTTGGAWTPGSSSTSGTCTCPQGGVFSLSRGCPAVSLTTQQQKSACESSNGEWTGTDDIGSCECPDAGRPTSQGACPEAQCSGDTLTTENCTIISYLVGGINFLSAVAGMAIVASITIAGYQYMTARDNSGQIEAAKKRIMWAMIALGLFIFMYAFLNFLVPGGLL